MEQILLKHIFKFSSGKNITRMSDRAACVYTSEDFERDLHNNNNYAESKCIINLIKSQAAPISRESIGKEVISNFWYVNLTRIYLIRGIFVMNLMKVLMLSNRY